MPGFYDFAAQSCSPPGRVFRSQHPPTDPTAFQERPAVAAPGAGWDHAKLGALVLSGGARRRAGASAAGPPWCSDGSAAWESFLLLLASTLNFPVLPTTFPWIGVKSGFGSVLAPAQCLGEMGPVLVPVEGMEAASPACLCLPSTSRPGLRYPPALWSKAWTRHLTLSLEKGIFF